MYLDNIVDDVNPGTLHRDASMGTMLNNMDTLVTNHGQRSWGHDDQWNQLQCKMTLMTNGTNFMGK